MLKLKNFLILIIIICNFCLYYEYKNFFPSTYEVYFIDNSLGDSILIKTPNNIKILIDGSADPEISNKVSRHLSFFNKKIHYLILTHGDKDHLAGFIDIINRYEVDNLLWTGAEKDTKIFKTFLQHILEKKINYYIITEQTDYQLDHNLIIDFLYPLKNISYLKNHTNNESLVFKMKIFDKTIMFTGDIEKKVEKELIFSGEELKSNVLKLAHHGSKTSSTKPFLQIVNPEEAIIIADINNRYNHPHQVIIDRLNELGIKYRQTGKDGDIELRIKN